MVLADKVAEGVLFLALEERDLKSRMGGRGWIFCADTEGGHSARMKLSPVLKKNPPGALLSATAL